MVQFMTAHEQVMLGIVPVVNLPTLNCRRSVMTLLFALEALLSENNPPIPGQHWGNSHTDSA